MNRDTLTRAMVFVGLMAVAIGVRLVTPWPNFGAVMAASLFGAFYFRNQVTTVALVLFTMVASDYFLGGYDKLMMFLVYASFLLPLAWRPLLRANVTVPRVGFSALSSTLLFFVTTNAGVWYIWYPHDWEGLARCYANAVPFLRHALTGDLLFCTAFFGAYALAAYARSPKREIASTACGKV